MILKNMIVKCNPYYVIRYLTLSLQDIVWSQQLKNSTSSK